MKKKGFTLIELLAVIVILAIIALIATPLVLKYIEKSRKESKVDSAYSFVRNLETEIANYSIKHNGKKYNGQPSDKGYYELDSFNGSEIDTTVKGENPTDGKVCISSVGQVEKGIFEYNEGKYYVLYDGKKGSISDKDTYNNFSCSGNNDFFERVYEYGDEVTFNPGDGDRTWNVIDEDKDTVTLMLTENLGNTVAWYAESNHNSRDNSYGPKDALEYLNSLTKDWNNVDPIESYSYVNNLNGTAKPNGYQKIEITNGVTTLTHKDGTTTKLDETYKAKARLLTLEEILEIASKTNKNLTKENLEGYITKNLEAINTALGITATNVDEVITGAMVQENYEYLQYESKNVQLYHIVLTMAWFEGIDIEHNILFPEYLYQNLNGDEGPEGYWTLSAGAGYSDDAWAVSFGGLVNNDGVGFGHYDGVRPVITVSKSKL